ncbi:MAG TPA: hypothetical protein VI913_00070 [Candidatus Peribacteraceae bacterium]|nr:hypothetical protein [Candidatus Peribacteraceae bacterium]
MHLYSQRDPAYSQLSHGAAGTIHDYGCFLVSVGNLYQRSPVELCDVTGIFTPEGWLVSSVAAKSSGGESLPKTTTAPQGWCIAVTKDIPNVGMHFFCVNPDTKEMIDPLKHPALIEPLKYKIVEYRPFTNIKLDAPKKPPASLRSENSGRQGGGSLDTTGTTAASRRAERRDRRRR